jgi:hypothetical protein
VQLSVINNFLIKGLLHLPPHILLRRTHILTAQLLMLRPL